MSRIIAWRWSAASQSVFWPPKRKPRILMATAPSTSSRSSREPVPAGTDGRTSPFQDFNVVTQGSEKIEGLFTLHKKGDHLYAEIRHDQFNQPLLAPVTIARGMAMAGHPLNRR